MFNYKNINKYQYYFFIFILLILFEGWMCKYSNYRINIDNSICEKYFLNFWSENGFVETFQVIFILSALLVIIYSLKKTKTKIEKRILLIIGLGLFYYLGEEISWGQHYLNFNTPVILKNINNQKEFNLHNISNLFDQLPRSLVFLFCSFNFVFILINKKFFKSKSQFLSFILPNNNLIFISLLLLLISLPDFLNDKMNLNLVSYVGNYKYEIITLNYIRLSELQELVFSFYFLNYSLALKYKLKL
tara:strand:- start:119 stop:856 length:738 start_codon:yes stop_codon:yes gene_type:complete